MNIRQPQRRLRCAIYTRKSSEEGLEMEFNSLDAQRESCEAYIASQRSEGLPPTRCQGLLLIDLAPESERPGEVLLMNRGRDQCRFPVRIDPSATGGYRFCAKQTSSDHVYCDHHHELVTAVEPRGSRARFNRAQCRIA